MLGADLPSLRRILW